MKNKGCMYYMVCAFMIWCIFWALVTNILEKCSTPYKMEYKHHYDISKDPNKVKYDWTRSRFIYRGDLDTLKYDRGSGGYIKK